MAKSFKQLLEDKKKKIESIRQKTNPNKTVETIIRDFLNDMNEKLLSCKDECEAKANIDLLSELFYCKIQKQDIYADVKLVFNEPEDWRKLYIDRIEIKWSEAFARDHGIEQERSYDIMDFILTDLN